MNGKVAHNTVGLVHFLVRGATITRQRHPAGVGDDPTLVDLVTDHRCQHRNRDVVETAHIEAGHEQIEEHVHAGPHFGYTRKIVTERCGRCGTDAHDWTCHTGGSEALSTAHNRIAFTPGHRADFFRSVTVVRIAGMRHHAAQFSTPASVQSAPDGE